MDIRFQEVVNYVNAVKLKDEDISRRSTVLGLAIAMAVAKHLPIPSSQVDDKGDYFNNSLVLARRIISDFNENVVFDLREAENYVRAFWNIRYSAVYPNTETSIDFTKGLADALSGVTNYLSNDVVAFADKYVREIFILSTICSSVVETSAEKY